MWVTTPSWLSGSLRAFLYSFVYFCHLFLISPASIRSLPFLSFMVPICVWNVPLYVCMLSRFSHVQLFATLWTVACQAPLSMGFSRQQYWSGLPSPPPGDLPNPGIESLSPRLLCCRCRRYWGSQFPKCSLGIPNFLKEISSLSHSFVFLYSFALFT